MGKYLDAAFVNAMTAVEIRKQHLLCLSYVIDSIPNLRDSEQREFSALYSMLHKRLNDAYETALLFAHATRKEEHIREARKIAYKHYLKRGMQIIHYQSLDLEYPRLLTP